MLGLLYWIFIIILAFVGYWLLDAIIKFLLSFHKKNILKEKELELKEREIKLKEEEIYLNKHK
jgi:hypothetical protein